MKIRKGQNVTVILEAKIPKSYIQKEIIKLAKIGLSLGKYNWYIPKNGVKIQ